MRIESPTGRSGGNGERAEPDKLHFLIPPKPAADRGQNCVNRTLCRSARRIAPEQFAHFVNQFSFVHGGSGGGARTNEPPSQRSTSFTPLAAASAETMAGLRLFAL